MNIKRVLIESFIDALETDTTGSNSYVVALELGAVPEDINYKYKNFQIIKAESFEEALEKYNKLNNCTYYHGSIIGKVIREL